MLTKVIPVARVVNAAARQQIVRCMAGHAPAHWKTEKEIVVEHKTHMNNLPVPEGSWQENYNKRSTKWNIQLGASVAFLLVTIYVFAGANGREIVVRWEDVKTMNQMDCFYLHGLPPLKKK